MNPYPEIPTLDLSSTRSWTLNDNYKYYIEEKVDGSQLSMMLNSENKLTFYNKNKLANENNAAFTNAIQMLKFKFVNTQILNPNYVYHGESVCKIKHNVNVYERTPKNYFILYDIWDMDSKSYLSSESKNIESERINIEIVPTLYLNTDPICSPYEICDSLIKQIELGSIASVLGGIPEGVVLKHHAYELNGKFVATKLKYVSDNFKERHKIKQPKCEMSADEYLTELGKSFCTNARFQKAYQHLVEDNKIDPNNVKKSDEGKIIGELNLDFDKEYKEELMLVLWLEFSPQIKKLARENTGTWFKDNFLDKK